MTQFTKDQALEKILSLFEFTDWEKRTDKPFNFYGEKDGAYSFCVDKRIHELHEVIDKLQDAFRDVNIQDYQIRIETKVPLYTVFHLEPRKIKEK